MTVQSYISRLILLMIASLASLPIGLDCMVNCVGWKLNCTVCNDVKLVISNFDEVNEPKVLDAHQNLRVLRQLYNVVDALSKLCITSIFYQLECAQIDSVKMTLMTTDVRSLVDSVCPCTEDSMALRLNCFDVLQVLHANNVKHLVFASDKHVFRVNLLQISRLPWNFVVEL